MMTDWQGTQLITLVDLGALSSYKDPLKPIRSEITIETQSLQCTETFQRYICEQKQLQLCDCSAFH